MEEPWLFIIISKHDVRKGEHNHEQSVHSVSYGELFKILCHIAKIKLFILKLWNKRVKDSVVYGSSFF